MSLRTYRRGRGQDGVKQDARRLTPPHKLSDAERARMIEVRLDRSLVVGGDVREMETAMFNKVLWPTESPEQAGRPLSCADEWRSLGFERVVLLHVTDVRHAGNVLRNNSGGIVNRGEDAWAAVMVRSCGGMAPRGALLV